MIQIDKLLTSLDEFMPDAKCALVFSSPFECLCAVMLSAQTTDKAVNLVTPTLFSKYPTPTEMAEASFEEVGDVIRSIGLYRNKAKNLIALAKEITDKYGGEVPLDIKKLTALPGVGIKTANVVLAECANRPAIAVDTHVSRVSKRLGLAKANDEPIEIEKKLEKKVPKDRQIKFHHQMIWFGRLVCHAKNPECDGCSLKKDCPYFKKISSSKGR
ncbi:MAG: endonuclease III [Bacilli bacterium]|nr:endonuclease III [Bacilli bacterium]